jgi:hypothetical protein
LAGVVGSSSSFTAGGLSSLAKSLVGDVDAVAAGLAAAVGGEAAADSSSLSESPWAIVIEMT